MSVIKVYTASRTTHAAHWRRIRDERSWGPEILINAQWIDVDDTKLGNEHTLTDDFLANEWTKNLNDIAHADVVVCYAAPGDSLRGALVEVGAALSWGTPVIALGQEVGNHHGVFGSWQFHPLVTRRKQDLDLWKLIPELAAK